MNLTHQYHSSQRRCYQIAGITVQVEAALPITDATFHPKFNLFEVEKPGDDIIFIRHFFHIPALANIDSGYEVYRRPPWVIYKNNGAWIYKSYFSNDSGILTGLWRQYEQFFNLLSTRSLKIKDRFQNMRQIFSNTTRVYLMSESNLDHTRVDIYHQSKREFRKGNLSSLSLFTTDQILLSRVLADRQGCYIHAGGIVLNENGLLFVGHSEAGKSTIVTMLKNKAKILCDDRMIIRKWDDGFRIHGSWSHGDVPDVSPDGAKLKAIFFLEKSKENKIIPINCKQESAKRLLACLIKPLTTADWWDKMLTLINDLVLNVPCYSIKFDKSGRIADLLKEF